MSIDQVSERARFAAREHVARWERETEEALPPRARDLVLFAYEMGYLRGHGDGVKAASTMFEEISQAGVARKKGDDDGK